MIPETIKQISGTEQVRPMVESRLGGCALSQFERRIYCAMEGVSAECLKPWFLGYRCWYLEWSKEEVKQEALRGVKEIRTHGGFTDEAVKHAERFRTNLRLVHGSITVKPKKRRIRAPAMI